MNLLSYIRNHGLARGGVKYVNVRSVKRQDILSGKCIDIYGDNAYIAKVLKEKFISYGGSIDAEDDAGRTFVVLCLGNDAFGKNINVTESIDGQTSHFKDLYFQCQKVYKEMKVDGRGNIIFLFSERLYNEKNADSVLGNAYRNFFEGIAKEGFEEIRCNAVVVDSKKIQSCDVIYAERVSELICFLLSNRTVCISGNTIFC